MHLSFDFVMNIVTAFHSDACGHDEAYRYWSNFVTFMWLNCLQLMNRRDAEFHLNAFTVLYSLSEGTIFE
jgi:hypothetical protein